MIMAAKAKLDEALRRIPREQRLYFGLLAFLLVVGVVLRSLGYFDDSNGLWNDEANWVLRMKSGIAGGNIRPPGYLALSKVIILTYPTEQMLRLPSYAAGIGSLFLFLSLSRLAGFTRPATVAGLALLALHPWVVAYAKEFKPYGPELFAALVLVTTALRYEKDPSLRNLVLLGLVGPSCVAFAWSAVFLFPGLFIALLLLQVRNRLKLQLFLSLGLAAAGTLVIVLLHLKRFKRLFSGKSASGESYWGNKYGVFYLEKGGFSGKLRWLVDKTWDIAGFPGDLHAGYTGGHALAHGLGLLLAVLALVGLVVLFLKRDWVRILLFAAPWFWAAVANWLGVWPYGVFRTNVFILAYPLLLTCVTLSELSKTFGEKRVAFAAAFALIPFFPLDFRYFRNKDVATNAFSSSLGTSLAIIQEKEKGKRPVEIYLDGYACGTYRYYVKVHPRFRVSLANIGKRAHVTCSGNEPSELVGKLQKKGPPRAWVITARPASERMIRPLLAKDFRIRFDRPLETPDTLLLVERKTPAPTSP